MAGSRGSTAKKGLSKVPGFWDGVVSSLGLFGGFLIIVISGMATVDIFSRYFLRSPVVWVGEISEYLLLVSVFLTLALSWREDRHVRVDILYVFWSKKRRVRANLIFSFWALVFCGALTWYGILQVVQAIAQGDTSVTFMSLPTWPVLIFIPIGAFLLCIQIIQSAWKMARGEAIPQEKEMPKERR